MIDKNILYPLFLAFAISVALSPFIIPFLQRLKVGQTERKEGVQSHLKKAGTPTMGGLIILISVVVTSLFFIGRFPKVIPVLFLILGFGIIGFLDDYLKVVLRRSDGLYPKQKMLGQIIVTAVFVVYLWIQDPSSLEILIPFSGGKVLSGDWVRIASAVIAFPAIIGTVNGVNFTDGLDGLATGVTTMVAVFFTAASVTLGAGIEPLTAAVTGALIGFLLFNVYPAKVFMGDTGSLALGGFVAGAAYAMRLPMFILIIGLIYGSISGYAGGKVDMVMMRIVDIIYSLPDMLMVILLSVVLKEVLTPVIQGTFLDKIGSNMISLFIVFGVLYWVGMARLVRGQILSIKENEYILAARSIGAKPGRIIRKHILPNCLSVIIISTALQVPSAIFTESFLSFVSLGVQAPMPSLGSLANAARGGMMSYPHKLVFPSIVICLIVLAFNLLGDGLRDAFDPKLRR